MLLVFIFYSGTPSVQYNYSDAGAVNQSRETSRVYASGYELERNYDSGVDSNVGRLSSLSDGDGTLESYTYHGARTVVRRSHPLSGVDLT